ncbi:MAG: endo-1,4-beta-xylanase [Clostridia bacterium]|nr:endo-1,4-beta-xylanase [Clostridia bacterium]
MSNQFENVIKEFDKYSYYTEGKIARGIEENRKGQFALVFKDKNGKKLSDVRVRVKQVGHEFNFGCNLFYINHYPTGEMNRPYEEKFKKIFNYGVVPLYWDALEPEEGKPRFDVNSEKIFRRPPVDETVNFCRENGLRMKGHCLIYNSFNPDWMSEDNREIKVQVDNRLRALSERYGNTFCDVDVINEMYRIYKNCYKGMGCRNLQITDEPEHEKWAFDTCKRYFPSSRLFWNEGMFEVLGEANYSGFRSYYYLAIKEALSRGVPVEGIGIQYHANVEKEYEWAGNPWHPVRHVTNPLRLLDALECYGSLGLPIHISEISLPSYGYDPHDEEVQAEITRRLMRLWFSAKSVSAIVWWNLADKTAIGDENLFHSGLLREDLSEKPAYKVMDELINREWNTSFEANVNERLNFAGFYGDYEIEAEAGGKKVCKNLRLLRDNTGYDNRHCDFRTKEIIVE